MDGCQAAKVWDQRVQEALDSVNISLFFFFGERLYVGAAVFFFVGSEFVTTASTMGGGRKVLKVLNHATRIPAFYESDFYCFFVPILPAFLHFQEHHHLPYRLLSAYFSAFTTLHYFPCKLSLLGMLSNQGFFQCDSFSS